MIRDSEEPASLARPTTFAASVDDLTGAITGGTFTAAPSAFQFDIDDPVLATVYVDATFTQLNPGAATGSVTMVSDTEAEVAVNIDVKVDLHIEVAGLGEPKSKSYLDADCTATPVSLRLRSTANYDFATDQVTLTDADFRVPAVPFNNDCSSLIGEGVNERLAGGGHAISMTMAGEIPEILDGTYRTTTALSVEPVVSRQGDEVTLTADTTSTDPALPASPPTIGGLVQFYDGTTLLGIAPVDANGRAVLAATDLPVGRRSLTARFQGDGVYIKSTSPTVTHLVAAAPTVTLPDPVNNIVIDGNPRPVTIGLANPAETGAPIDDARLELVLARVSSNTSILTPDRMSLEYFDGTTWTPVTLTEGPPRVLTGSITGVDLPPGETLDARFRYQAFAVGTTSHLTSCQADNPTCPGPLTLTAKLISDDSARTFATDEAPVNLIEHARRATSYTFPQGVIRPHTLRQGYSLVGNSTLGPNFGSVPWSGLVEAYIDGVQVRIRDSNTPFGSEPVDQFEVRSGAVTGAWILLPEDIEPGPHRLTMRYLGDPFHAPAETTGVFTVIERLPEAHPFVCREKTLTSNLEWGANIVFDAPLPGVVRSGTNVAFDVDDARLLMHRQTVPGPLLFAANNATTSVGTGNFDGVTFNLGGEGSASGTAVARTGGTGLPNVPAPAPESEVDQTYAVQGVSGSVTVSGAPGEVVPVELSELVFSYRDPVWGYPLEARCTARGGAMRLGEVEIAGTAVSASPAVAREGTDEVVIEARTYPADAAGTVSFSSDRDGALGTATVAAGVASLSTTTLSPGNHVITASFDTAGSALDSVGTTTVRVTYSPRSATEGFVVAARTDYLGSAERSAVVADAAALDGGKTKAAYLDELSRSDAYLTHVVNEMYRDTLGREGDAAGVAYWVGRLKGGLSVARVAASFYSSGEYYDRVGGTDEAWVRDLYDVLLGRDADDPGLAYWIGEIPRRGRGGVALAFFQTPESARARVTVLYQQFLGRNPNTADRNFWAARVIARGDLILAVELTLSPEYTNRAGTRFPLV